MNCQWKLTCQHISKVTKHKGESPDGVCDKVTIIRKPTNTLIPIAPVFVLQKRDLEWHISLRKKSGILNLPFY